MKIIGLAVVLSLGTLLSYGQTATKNPKTKTAAKPKTAASLTIPQSQPAAAPLTAESAKTLLWKISGKGMAKPSYLFGTNHQLCEQDAVLSESLKNLIKEVDGLCFELDYSNLADMAAAGSYSFMKDSAKLENLITKEEMERVKKFFETNKLSLPFQVLNTLKPLFVCSVIGSQMMKCPQKSMEMVIGAEAEKHRKPYTGLETNAYQTGLFDQLSYKKQAALLVQTVDSVHNMLRNGEALIKIYKEQDLKRLDSICHVGTQEEFPKQIVELVTYNRNKNWSTDIFKKNEDGAKSILFAVGAAHLGGTKGVIALLEQKGYTITPMSN